MREEDILETVRLAAERLFPEGGKIAARVMRAIEKLDVAAVKRLLPTFDTVAERDMARIIIDNLLILAKRAKSATVSQPTTHHNPRLSRVA
jgi:hypothetical protein